MNEFRGGYALCVRGYVDGEIRAEAFCIIDHWMRRVRKPGKKWSAVATCENIDQVVAWARGMKCDPIEVSLTMKV